MEYKFDHGDVVVDTITQFEGTVTGRSDYVTGCNQYLVQPRTKGVDKEFVEARWFDEMRLELVRKEPVKKRMFAGADKPAPRK